MAITSKIKYQEGPLSISNAKAETEVHYWLYSDDPANDDRDDALTKLLTDAPLTLYGLHRDKARIGEIVRDIDNATTQEKIWDAYVKYVNPERRRPKPLPYDPLLPSTDPQPTRLSIRSGGSKTKRRIYSRGIQEEVGEPDFLWAGFSQLFSDLINLRVDDSEDTGAMFVPEGFEDPIGSVEIVVETVRLNDNIQVDGYLVQLAEYAAKRVVNNATYKGFPAGSLELNQFSANQRGGENGDTASNVQPWDVVMLFNYQAGVAKGDFIMPPGLKGKSLVNDIKGHQAVDILYTNKETTEAISGAKFVLPTAQRLAVHDVREEIDFEVELKI